MCILRVNESPLQIRCLPGLKPILTVGKRRQLGSKSWNNIAFRDGYNLSFLIKPMILCNVIDDTVHLTNQMTYPLSDTLSWHGFNLHLKVEGENNQPQVLWLQKKKKKNERWFSGELKFLSQYRPAWQQSNWPWWAQWFQMPRGQLPFQLSSRE